MSRARTSIELLGVVVDVVKDLDVVVVLLIPFTFVKISVNNYITLIFNTFILKIRVI